jgi:Family of unknown function (DUF5684)
MNPVKNRQSSIHKWVWLGVISLSLGLLQAKAGMDENFVTLQVGTHVYSNVTVTTKAKSYIFILHSAGMTNIRVADLSPEAKRKLGYEAAEEKTPANTPAAWAKQTVAKLEPSQVQGLQKRLNEVWRTKITASGVTIPQLTTRFLIILGSVCLVMHVFFSYCCMLICQKTGGKPGILVFIPILQMIPLLRAAGMSAWWLLAFFVPILNLVTSILWCVKIVRARQKSGWLVLFLLLPVTSFFAFLYLAFSGGASAQKEPPRAPHIMTLETA